MNTQLLKAGLGAFVAMFLLSFLWYGIIASGYYETTFSGIARTAEEMSMPSIALGYLLLGFLLAYAFPHGYTGGSATSEGARFGLLMGLLIALPQAFINAGAYDVPLQASLVDALYRLVEITVAGMVTALLYGGGAAEASSAVEG